MLSMRKACGNRHSRRLILAVQVAIPHPYRPGWHSQTGRFYSVFQSTADVCLSTDEDSFGSFWHKTCQYDKSPNKGKHCSRNGEIQYIAVGKKLIRLNILLSPNILNDTDSGVDANQTLGVSFFRTERVFDV